MELPEQTRKPTEWTEPDEIIAIGTAPVLLDICDGYPLECASYKARRVPTAPGAVMPPPLLPVKLPKRSDGTAWPVGTAYYTAYKQKGKKPIYSLLIPETKQGAISTPSIIAAGAGEKYYSLGYTDTEFSALTEQTAGRNYVLLQNGIAPMVGDVVIAIHIDGSNLDKIKSVPLYIRKDAAHLSVNPVLYRKGDNTLIQVEIPRSLSVLFTQGWTVDGFSMVIPGLEEVAIDRVKICYATAPVE